MSVYFIIIQVETIGDAYMVVSGLPTPNVDNHARDIALMALKLLKSVTTFKIRHKPDRTMKLRIGIHSGKISNNAYWVIGKAMHGC